MLKIIVLLTFAVPLPFWISAQSTLVAQQQGYPRLKKHGIIFEFRGCQKKSDSLTHCSFLMTNNDHQERQTVTVYSSGNSGSTRIVDTSGNELAASQVTLGDTSGSWVHNDLVQGVPVRGTAVFKGRIDSDIKLFDLYVESPNVGRYHVEFVRSSS